MSENTKKIDSFEDSIAVNAGAPVEVKLFDMEFNIRRDYTGDEVHSYIKLFAEPTPSDKLAETVNAQVKALTDLNSKDREKLVDTMMQYPIIEMNSILIKMGQIAGLRGTDTGFLTGALHSAV